MLFRSATAKIGQYKKRGGVLPQQEMGSIKSGGAAAWRSGQYKFDGAAAQYKSWGRCRSGKWSVLKAGALPQREVGSINSGSAAAARIVQYKRRGRCRNENWAV